MFTENCIKIVKRFEGLQLTAYLCPSQIWTIGYGTTEYPDGTPVRKGDKINLQQAEEFLLLDLTKYSNAVHKYVNSLIDFNQYDALISFAYNVGITAFKNSTLLHLVNTNPSDLNIHNQFIRWRYITKNGKKVPSKGLFKRRNQESQLYFKNLKNKPKFTHL